MSVTPNSFISVQTPKLGLGVLLPADGVTTKVVVTAGANGSKVSSLQLASLDTSDKTVIVSIYRGAQPYCLFTGVIPAGSGLLAGIPVVNAFAPGVCPGLPVDNDGQPYLFLNSGDTLCIQVTVTVTAAKFVTAAACYGDF